MGPQQAVPGVRRPQPRQATPEQIHAQLDAREKQLKEQLKKIQAVRTLMPPQADNNVPRGSSAGPTRPRGSVPGIDAAIQKAGG